MIYIQVLKPEPLQAVSIPGMVGVFQSVYYETKTSADTQSSGTLSPSPTPPLTRKKKGKRVCTPSSKPKVTINKWSITEEEYLGRAFIHIFVDSNTGNNQKGNDFWARVHKYFCDEIGSSCRSANNLKSHWHMMANPLHKFTEFYSRNKNNGSADDQVLSLTKKEYMEEVKTVFKYEHVWDVVKNEPKWFELAPFQSKRAKTSVSGDRSTLASDAHTTNIDVSADDAPNSIENIKINLDHEFDELAHPADQKKSEPKTTSNATPESVDKPTERMENFMDGKAQTMDLFKEQMTQVLFNQDMNILMMDRTHLDPERLAIHLELCDQIKKRHNMS